MDDLKFSQIMSRVDELPGLYEIYTADGMCLKVGISVNLRKRLIAHGKSQQGRLRLKINGLGYTLENVQSKQSILAKHLYFDSTLTTKYDLKSEIGRVSFLENECLVKCQYTSTKDEARELERIKEVSGNYRYVGRVLQR